MIGQKAIEQRQFADQVVLAARFGLVGPVALVAAGTGGTFAFSRTWGTRTNGGAENLVLGRVRKHSKNRWQL